MTFEIHSQLCDFKYIWLRKSSSKYTYITPFNVTLKRFLRTWLHKIFYSSLAKGRHCVKFSCSLPDWRPSVTVTRLLLSITITNSEKADLNNKKEWGMSLLENVGLEGFDQMSHENSMSTDQWMGHI